MPELPDVTYTRTLADILNFVSRIVESAIGWMGDFLQFIVAPGHEILLLFILIPCVGLGVGLLRRLMSL